jgi:nucleotide-binding universal stress UspA family protein
MKNILVAVDLNDKEGLVLKKAADFANSFDSKLWIVHVAAPEPDFVGYEPGPQSVRDSRAAELREKHRLIQKYADELKEKGTNVESLLIQGSIIESILKEVEKLKADLLIIGHEDHDLLYKIINSDVSKKIINKSKTSVLVVPLS